MKKNPVEYYAHAASQRIVCLEEPFSVMAVNGEGMIKVNTSANKRIAEEWNSTKNNLAIAGSSFFYAVLKTDGTVRVWGLTDQTDQKLKQQTKNWHKVKWITAIGSRLLAVHQDGSLSCAGLSENWHDSIEDRWKHIVSLSAGTRIIAGLRKDGRVLIAGKFQEEKFGADDWSDITQIACGSDHVAGCKKDGAVLAVGCDRYGQCKTGSWKDIVSIACGDAHTAGVRRDGTVTACGDDSHGQCQVEQWKDIIAVAAGPWHTIGIRKDGLIQYTRGRGERYGIIPWKLFSRFQYEQYEILHRKYHPDFLKLADRCSTGDSNAMLHMACWFWRQKCSDRKREPFYKRAFCTWMVRAAGYGNQKAAAFLKKHPGCYALSYLPGGMLVKKDEDLRIQAEILRNLGFLEILGEKRVALHGPTDEGLYYYETYAGYEGADSDGFGMEEEYNYHFYDEFLNHICTCASLTRQEFEREFP